MHNPVIVTPKSNHYPQMSDDDFKSVYQAAQADAQVYADPLFSDYLDLNQTDNPLAALKGLTFKPINADPFTVGEVLTVQQLHQIARNDLSQRGYNINCSGVVFQNLHRSYGLKDAAFYHAILCARFLVGQSFIMAKTKHDSIGGYGSAFVRMKPRPCYAFDLAGLQLQTAENDAMVGCVLSETFGGPWRQPSLRAFADQAYQALVGGQKPTLEEAINDKGGRFIKLKAFSAMGEAYLDLKFVEAKVYNDYYKTFKALNATSQVNQDCVSFSFIQYSTGFFSKAIEGGKAKFCQAIRQGQLRALEQLALEGAAAEPAEFGIKMLKFPHMNRQAMDQREQKAWDEAIKALKAKGLWVYQTDDKGFGWDTAFQPFFFGHKINDALRNQWIEALNSGDTEDGKQTLKTLDAMVKQKKCRKMLPENDEARRLAYLTLLNMVEAATNAGDTHVHFGNEFDHRRKQQESVDAMVAGNLVNPCVLQSHVNHKMTAAVSHEVPPLTEAWHASFNQTMRTAGPGKAPLSTAKVSRSPFRWVGVSMILVGALALMVTLFSKFNVLNFSKILPLSNDVMIAMITVSLVLLVLGIGVSMIQPKSIPAAGPGAVGQRPSTDFEDKKPSISASHDSPGHAPDPKPELPGKSTH